MKFSGIGGMLEAGAMSRKSVNVENTVLCNKSSANQFV